MQIVPESIRTSVYAFDRCITGAIGAAFTPLAGVLAERVFGFKASPHHSAGAPPPPATGTAFTPLAGQVARVHHPLSGCLACMPWFIDRQHTMCEDHSSPMQVQRMRHTRQTSTGPTCSMRAL